MSENFPAQKNTDPWIRKLYIFKLRFRGFVKMSGRFPVQPKTDPRDRNYFKIVIAAIFLCLVNWKVISIPITQAYFYCGGFDSFLNILEETLNPILEENWYSNKWMNKFPGASSNEACMTAELRILPTEDMRDSSYELSILPCVFIAALLWWIGYLFTMLHTFNLRD